MSYTFWFDVFFFNDTATTEIYPLSLPDALPISALAADAALAHPAERRGEVPDEERVDPHGPAADGATHADRKSTRLNSSHANISYAVFCLKKKKKTTKSRTDNTN